MATWSPRLTFYQLIETSMLTSLSLAKLSTVSPEFHWASPERMPVTDWYPLLKLGIVITSPPLEQNESEAGELSKEKLECFSIIEKNVE